jgi:flagellar biosynthesis anti-sigma factor FlgM
MKVENNPLNPLSTRKTEETRAVDSSRKASNSGQVAPKDQASVSDRARMLSKARVAFSEAPEVRSEVVDALKKKISEGSYEIQYSGLAKKMYTQGKH